jgi:hypothetical protein
MTHDTPRRRRVRSILAVPIAVLALLATLAGPAAAAPLPRLFHGTLQTSSNWAGYAVTGLDASTQYKSVSGTWVQPAATCDPASDSYSAFWVGLGGFSETSQALEQIGTAADCRNGTATYSVWYELVPAASVPTKLKLYPGNTVSATVTVSGSSVTLKLANLTRKTSFTKKLTMATPDVTSAEWVAEAPSSCTAAGQCQVLPLSKFGSVTFTKATATTTAGLAGTISNPAWDATPIELAPASGRFGRFRALPMSTGTAVPGALSADGSSFGVAWQDAAVAPTPTPVPVPTPAAVVAGVG